MTLIERVADVVLSKKETARTANISTDTLDRLAAKGEGPRRLKLSARRVGYRLSDIEAWLKSRELVAG